MNTLSVLQGLIQMLQTGEEGFRTAESDVASPELKSIFREHALQRRKFVNALQTLARSVDEGKADETFSVGQVFANGRLWESDSARDDSSVVCRCERAEADAVAHYEKALCQRGLPDHVIDVLHDQYLKIRAAHEGMMALCDAVAGQGALAEALAPAAP